MSIGIWQVVLILAIVLIIFGAGKLPRVMGDLAKGIKSFKSGMQDNADGEPKADTKVINAEATERTAPAEKKEPAKG
ncbi:MAG: twin-arginine translocase TatA/TatE family subunit [Alphaproteobacteria bacterium]|nr:twin-arginine translocase TatA/TatE family subunit [Alphaproteobacteria bacterium]